MHFDVLPSGVGRKGACHLWETPFLLWWGLFSIWGFVARKLVFGTERHFWELSSMEDLQDDLCCLICWAGVKEFGTEACFKHILVPRKPEFLGR